MKKFFSFILTVIGIPLALLSEEAVQEIPDLPTAPSMPSYEGAFLKMILSLLTLLALVGLTLWIMKRLNRSRWRGFGSQRSIQILERKPLSPKSILYLVEVEGHRFLIAESQLEVRRLGAVTPLSEENPST